MTTGRTSHVHRPTVIHYDFKIPQTEFLGTEKPHTTVHAQHLLCRGMGMHCAGALRLRFVIWALCWYFVTSSLFITILCFMRVPACVRIRHTRLYALSWKGYEEGGMDMGRVFCT